MRLSFVQAVILGIVQGVTEFLPVSSSGHLVIFSYILGWGSGSLFFDTMLHFGTGIALLVYFWKDLLLILKEPKKLKIILAGVLPSGLVGFLLSDWFENTFRLVGYVVLFLLLGSLLMLTAEFYFHKFLTKPTKKDLTFFSLDSQANNFLTIPRAFLLGLFQILALFPGFSRSGATISGGLFLGLSRKDSARFSFWLSLPVILGAGILQLVKLLSGVGGVASALVFWQEAVVGVLASFLSGLVCVKILMKFLENNSLLPFVVYRVLLSILLFFLLI